MRIEAGKEITMTSSTVIAQLHLTDVEIRRREGIERTMPEARKSRRRRIRRPRGVIGGSPPGAGGRLLQL
jgi:hypothetical protein